MFANLKGKTIVVTGHTGFKGAWLSLWLHRLGAKVHGLALAPPDGEPSLHELLDGEALAGSHLIDIRNYDAVLELFRTIKPDAVFHLAAQALVRRSYRDPLESFSSNIMGTAHVLEACRHLDRAPAIVCVTTDKVYDNLEWVFPYRETDVICGKDPYSASKAGAEMIAACYQRSLFALKGDARPRLAIARGGNVIGGGDWAEDRIIPDAIRGALANEPLRIRNPDSVRPWQHVLELCHGYMTLADGMLSETPERYEGPWNFGPDPMVITTVAQVAQRLSAGLSETDLRVEMDRSPSVPESGYLTLDISKAMRELQWVPGLKVEESIDMTSAWYDAYLRSPADARALTDVQLADYAARRGAPLPTVG